MSCESALAVESSPSANAPPMFTANVAIARMGTDIDACQRSSVPAAAVTTNSTAITPTPPAHQGTRSGRARD